MFLKFLDGEIFLKTLWVFLLEFPNSKITLATLATSSDIDLGRFVSERTCIIQRLKNNILKSKNHVYLNHFK